MSANFVKARSCAWTDAFKMFSLGFAGFELCQWVFIKIFKWGETCSDKQTKRYVATTSERQASTAAAEAFNCLVIFSWAACSASRWRLPRPAPFMPLFAMF